MGTVIICLTINKRLGDELPKPPSEKGRCWNDTSMGTEPFLVLHMVIYESVRAVAYLHNEVIDMLSCIGGAAS